MCAVPSKATAKCINKYRMPSTMHNDQRVKVTCVECKATPKDERKKKYGKLLHFYESVLLSFDFRQLLTMQYQLFYFCSYFISLFFSSILPRIIILSSYRLVCAHTIQYNLAAVRHVPGSVDAPNTAQIKTVS